MSDRPSQTCRKCRVKRPASQYPGRSAICLTCIPAEKRVSNGLRKRWERGSYAQAERRRFLEEKREKERREREAAAEDERIARLLRQHREDITA